MRGLPLFLVAAISASPVSASNIRVAAPRTAPGPGTSASAVGVNNGNGLGHAPLTGGSSLGLLHGTIPPAGPAPLSLTPSSELPAQAQALPAVEALPLPAAVPGMSPAPAAAPDQAEPLADPAGSGLHATPPPADELPVDAAPGSPETGSGVFARLGRLFDGAPGEDVPLEAPDYLQAPPAIPLSALPGAPTWEKLEPPAKDKAKGSVFFRTDKSETLKEGQSQLLSQDKSAPPPWEKGRSDAEASDVSANKAWIMPPGSKDAVFSNGSLHWIDPNGRLVVYSLKDKQAVAYTSSEGPVSRIIVKRKDRVFAVVGDKLERLDVELLYARTYPGLKLDPKTITRMVQGEDSEFSDTMTFHFPAGRLKESGSGIILEEGGLQSFLPGSDETAPLIPAGKGIYFRHEAGATRAWRGSSATGEAEEYGSIPFKVLAMTPGLAMDTLYAAVPE
ncbi:MAG: hypothetical protein WC943_14330, partial [Elusimicrobiota bacterium]